MITKRALLRTLERERDQAAAERKLLIDQILHLTGHPWTPAPQRDYVAAPEPLALEDRPWASPEQHITV